MSRQPRALRVHLYNRAWAATLVRFALASQIEQLGPQYRAGDVVGLSPQIVSRLVRGPNTTKPRAMQPTELRHLADIQDVLARDDRRYSSLVAFHGRLFPTQQHTDVSIPVRWADALVQYDARSLVEVLVQGEALLGAVLREPRRTPASVRRIVDDLIHVGGLPAVEGIEALQLVARFAEAAATRRLTFDRLLRALESRPTGFRAWRAVSLVARRRADTDDSDSETMAAVEREIRALFDQDLPNAHPSRSLDMEAAASAPAQWTWANDVLSAEATAVETTPRRLAYAALARWERRAAPEGPEVLDPFVDRAAQEAPRSEHYAWVLENLRAVRAGGDVADLPETDVRREVERVVRRRVAEDIALSDRLRLPARYLILHGLLSNHGLARRVSLDTLRTGWLAPLMADVVAEVVATMPPWIAGMGAFAIGFMGERSGEEVLRHVLALPGDGYDTLGAVEAAAWSVGELWASDDGTGTPDWVVEELRGVVDRARSSTPESVRLGRAAAYSLAVMAPPEARDLLAAVAQSSADSATRQFGLLGSARYPDAGRPSPLIEMRHAGESVAGTAELA